MATLSDDVARLKRFPKKEMRLAEYNSILGGLDSDTILGSSGNDLITGGGGDDYLDGGLGVDTVLYSGDQKSYILAFSKRSTIIEDRRGIDGTDYLSNFEFIGFSSGELINFDQIKGSANLSREEFVSVIELYIAYFNRAPDALGLNFWGNAFSNGTTLEGMAKYFIDQEETREIYSALASNLDFATAVYNNVLGRIPDQAGLGFWVDLLNREEVTGVSRDQFILEVLRGVQDGSPDSNYLDQKVDLGIYFSVTKGLSDLDNAIRIMDIYNGTESSLVDAKVAIDSIYEAALDPDNGEFMLHVGGVLIDPFFTGL